MASSMQFTLTKPVSEIFAKAQAFAIEHDSKVVGDECAGKVYYQNSAATYEITNNTLSIIIEKKPFWLPESAIKKAIEKWLESQ